jgi:hypothetical protein
MRPTSEQLRLLARVRLSGICKTLDLPVGCDAITYKRSYSAGPGVRSRRSNAERARRFHATEMRRTTHRSRA